MWSTMIWPTNRGLTGSVTSVAGRCPHRGFLVVFCFAAGAVALPVVPTIPGAGGGARLVDPDSIAHWAFLIPSGLFTIVNDPVIWAAELPAANGMGDRTRAGAPVSGGYRGGRRCPLARTGERRPGHR